MMMCFVRAVTASLCFSGLRWTFTNTSNIHFMNFLLGLKEKATRRLFMMKLRRRSTDGFRDTLWHSFSLFTHIDTNIKWVRWHLLHPSLSPVARLRCRGNRARWDWWERTSLILRQVNVGFSSSTFEVHQYGNGTQWILIFSLGMKPNMITGFSGIIVCASESHRCDAAVDFTLYCILAKVPKTEWNIWPLRSLAWLYRVRSLNRHMYLLF